MAEPTPFPINAAKFCWMAPIAAIALNIFSRLLAISTASQGQKPDPMMQMIFSGLCGLLIVGGLVAGAAALLGIKKYGKKRILLPAVIGIVVNLSLIVAAYTTMMRARVVAEIVKLGGDIHLTQNGTNLKCRKMTDDALAQVKVVVGTRLRILDLRYTEVTDSGVLHLAEMAKLVSLNLKNTRVTDTGLMHLKDMTKLKSLDLANTRVTDAALIELSNLTNLRSLDLADTQVTDAALIELSNRTNLRGLRLSGTRITNKGLEYLKAMTDLEGLDLSRTRVTDAGMAHLEGLTKLENLGLTPLNRSTGYGITTARVQELQEALPNCNINGRPPHMWLHRQ